VECGQGQVLPVSRDVRSGTRASVAQSFPFGTTRRDAFEISLSLARPRIPLGLSEFSLPPSIPVSPSAHFVSFCFPTD
jgi:hypothetical protein